MKLLMFHTNDLKIKAGLSRKHRKANEKRLRKRLGNTLPELTDANRIIQTNKSTLLVFACVERGDELLNIKPIKNEILKARALLGVIDIVVCAFGHLSESPAEAMLAREITDRLVEEIKSEHPTTLQVPFGWDKTLEIAVPMHHYNVSFKSFHLVNE